MIEQIKALFLVALSALSAFFMPIEDFVAAILILMGVNFVTGWIEDTLHADGWKWAKVRKTFVECCVLVAIGAFVFVMGHFMHMKTEAVQAVCCIYMAAIWFYCINILKNWQKILKEGTTLRAFVDFLHWVVALRFVEKIPLLKEYVNLKEEEK